MLAVDLLANGVFQSVKIVKPKTFRQLIVDAGISLFLNICHSHFKNRQFTGKMLCLIIFRECHGHIALLIYLGTNQPIFKPGDEAV